jgi:glucan phosphorylase
MNTEDLLEQYSCGPVKFSGRDDALYDRHLMFDQVAPITNASTREQFEAATRSVRDVLSQRWIKTEQTYQQRNAKRVYYLSMEYLMGRALANNITNLRIEPGLFAPIVDALLRHGDHYRHLADLTSYGQAHQRLGALYADPEAWGRQVVLNIAASGQFSSDRTIAEYARKIWQVAPVPVD